ncbi:ROK family protein, partial [Rubrobacter calidifluminis]|uniref:ROK family protein n=1 Tax=Rubrobacter calidifluminis TaxID=1392640 RepID=UPI00235EF117
VNAFDPELVVVGGSTAEAGELLLEPAREMVSKHALEHVANRVRVVRGTLGEDAGAIGAAALVLRELFTVSLAGTNKVFAGEVAGVRGKGA